jgi:hypothetical protein
VNIPASRSLRGMPRISRPSLFSIPATGLEQLHGAYAVGPHRHPQSLQGSMDIGGKASARFSRQANHSHGGVFQPVKAPRHVVARHPVHLPHTTLQQGLDQLGGDLHGRRAQIPAQHA